MIGPSVFEDLNVLRLQEDEGLRCSALTPAIWPEPKKGSKADAPLMASGSDLPCVLIGDGAQPAPRTSFMSLCTRIMLTGSGG